MSAYSVLVLSLNPVGYWRLGEPSGTNVNNEVGTDGTYSGTLTLAQTGVLIGDADTAVLFGGGYATVGTQIISHLTNASVEAWVKCTATNDAIYVERAGSGNDIWKIQTEEQNLANWGLVHRDDAGTLTWCPSTVAIMDGAWHHIVVTKAGTAVKLYVDGAAAGTATLNGGNTMTNSGLEARLGSDKGDGSMALGGTLDEVAVYDYALSPAQVLGNYNVGTVAPSGVPVLLLGGL